MRVPPGHAWPTFLRVIGTGFKWAAVTVGVLVAFGFAFGIIVYAISQSNWFLVIVGCALVVLLVCVLVAWMDESWT